MGGTALVVNGLLNMEHFICLLNATSRNEVAVLTDSPLFSPKLAAIFQVNSISFGAKPNLN